MQNTNKIIIEVLIKAAFIILLFTNYKESLMERANLFI